MFVYASMFQIFAKINGISDSLFCKFKFSLVPAPFLLLISVPRWRCGLSGCGVGSARWRWPLSACWLAISLPNTTASSRPTSCRSTTSADSKRGKSPVFADTVVACVLRASYMGTVHQCWGSLTFWCGSESAFTYLKFCVKILFCKYNFSPLNSFMRKGKDPEPKPDPYLWLMDPDPDPGDPKHADQVPDPDPQHWGKRNRKGFSFGKKRR